MKEKINARAEQAGMRNVHQLEMKNQASYLHMHRLFEMPTAREVFWRQEVVPRQQLQ